MPPGGLLSFGRLRLRPSFFLGSHVRPFSPVKQSEGEPAGTDDGGKYPPEILPAVAVFIYGEYPKPAAEECADQGADAADHQS